MHYPKIYRDENYPDPAPNGNCIICGREIFRGDVHYRTDEGLICDGRVAGKIETEKAGAIHISCLCAYLAESCSENEAAAAVGVERMAGT